MPLVKSDNTVSFRGYDLISPFGGLEPMRLFARIAQVSTYFPITATYYSESEGV